MMMEVEYDLKHPDAPALLAALLDEFSTVTAYRALHDTLPRRLTNLLRCHCVLLYQRSGETLQFAAGSFADQPGWSAKLLAVAHINPIELHDSLPEARAWRTRGPVLASVDGMERGLIAAPLLYRQRASGVLTAIRGSPLLVPGEEKPELAATWSPEEVPLVAVVANLVAMLLEHTRLLERDQERIHELSLLNGMSGQMTCALRDRSHVYRIVTQRTREICGPDLCEVLLPGATPALPSWLPPELHSLLARRWQRALHYLPLVLERSSETQDDEYLGYLSPRIKTFFALPLVGASEGAHGRGGASFGASASLAGESQGARVFGVVVGAYHTPRKLRREELVLLQVLANQASAVLENIALVEDVIAARNEARRLLHQVLDDRRLKELILESIPSGLITLDMRGQVTTFNRAAGQVLGYHPREVLGQPLAKILNPRNLAEVLRTGQPRHEILLTTGGREQELALDLTLAPLRDDQGRQIGALATFADMTTLYQLEEEKRRLDRLASLGEMAASVAHEVRNPLASIKTSMQLLLDDLQENTLPQEDAREAISVVLKEVERLDGIVRDLLLFARPRQLHLVECDLLELCARLLRFLQPQCDERGVRVHLVQQRVPPVRIDVAQMEQVLMNLFLNALQAMPAGGVLSVSGQVLSPSARDQRTCLQPVPASSPLDPAAGPYSGGEAPERERSEQDQQSWLELAISDTGEGISQEALARIFQPFYTTRAHGIGLGLPITRRLIEDHHGYMLVESRLGYGTTVSLRLPLNVPCALEQKQPAQRKGAAS
jgi:PAS domain S-box-containing protein